MIDIQQFEVKEVIFKPRKVFNDLTLRPELEEFIDHKVTVTASFMMDEEDTYPGEWALTGPNGERLFGRAWMPSGDFVEITE